MGAGFICNLCSTPFWLSTEQLKAGLHLHSCDKCGALCSVQQLPPEEPGGVGPIQLHGCELKEASADSEPTNPDEISPERTVVDESPPDQDKQESMLAWIQEEAESKEEAALEGVVHEWRIERQNGQTFSFHFLTALRKWIMDGRVIPGDSIKPHGGAIYRIEEYPGTADLFANIDIMKKRREAVLTKKRRNQAKKIGWRHFRHRHFEIAAGLLFMSLCLAFGAKFGWERYEFTQSVKRAEQYLNGLVRLELASPQTKSLDHVVTLLWRDEDKNIKQAMNYLTGYLSENKTNLNAICLLAESLVRRAGITANVSELTLAKNLLDYLKSTGQNPLCLYRAESVYFWSQGLVTKANELIQRYLDQTNEPFGFYVAALLASDAGDLKKAKRQLDLALRLAPSNTIFLAKLGKIFEKEGKWREAIALFSQALEKEPMNQTILKRLASCYEKSGDILSAENTYRVGMQMGEDPEEFQFLLVSLFSNHKDPEEIIKAADFYLEQFPDGDHNFMVQQYNDRAKQRLAEMKQKAYDKKQRNQGLTGRSRPRLWMRR